MRKLENIRQDRNVLILKKSDSSLLKGGDYIDLMDWSTGQPPEPKDKKG